MQEALRGVPVAELSPPDGVVNISGEWYYPEFAHNAGVNMLGLPGGAPSPAVIEGNGLPRRAPSELHSGSRGEGTPGNPMTDRSLLNADGRPPPPAPNEERRSILDLFR
jgi:penicillin-binding protein 1A